MIRAICVCAALAALAGGCATTGTAGERAVISAKDKVAPALVHVRPVKEVFRQGQRQSFAVTGSGFIISKDGYVVTNEHVAGRSDYVRCVLYNRQEVDAEVVGVDPDSDIAVLKLRGTDLDLPVVKMGRSADLEAGQTVMALGSPHGLSRSVSLGIVSVTDRNLEDLGSAGSPFNNWIQTDAAINPGNSGGPLVNLKGEVIGINTRKLQGADNVGFAIPIDSAKEVIEEIIRYGKVARSSIGVILQEMTSFTDDASRPGVLIGDVDPLSPAFDAQLRPGDVLIAVDGTPTNARYTEDLPAVRKLIADKPVGETVSLTIERAGRMFDVPVATEEKSPREGEEIEAREWGCSVSSLTPDTIRRARLSARQGVLVTGVQVGQPLHTAGVRQGDIILTIDGELIQDIDQFERIYEELAHTGAPRILMTVKRGALSMFILVKQTGGPVPDAQAEPVETPE